jgi:3-deoxy-D-manno-octulosonate 8-phosphate phosphatase (KDO 8-P phosphatase)
VNSTERFNERARALELLSLDVDGVLTDGRLLYADDGRELKAFNVQDGASIKLLLQRGIRIAILTGRSSPMVERRAAELGVRHLYQGLEHKAPVLDRLAAELHIPLERVAHVGDDLPDLALFDLVGLAISVPNGHPVVRARADYVTATPGGEGVARELAELILRARADWPY